MSKKNLFVKKILGVVISLVLLFSVPSGSMAATTANTLTMYDSTITFKHFDYTLNADNSIKSTDPTKVVDQVFNTKVIENNYLKVTLLPDFGARIISIIYKPTGHELLYQNPVGTPYGIGEGNFYYNWLMVYGGIMPTFSEPEHGKFWLTPWTYQIVAQDSSKISIEMSSTDNVNFAGTPGKFNNGATGITCKSTYTVYADKPYVEMKVKLTNNKSTAVNYEYWTCNTLAPGSQPGNTIGSRTMEIVAPMTKVKNKDDWWPWMGTVDKAVDAANHIFEFKNLALFSNWADMGIAYANDLSGNWWGVINHDNQEGILRIADNAQATPGLKLWTWGYNQSYNTDPMTYGNSARPYIELWGGNSSEFFVDATLQPSQQKEWTEYYMPTVGLEKVTNANQDAAAYLKNSTSGSQATFNADIFTTRAGETLKATLKLVGSNTYTLLDQSFTGSASNVTKLTASKDVSTIAAGNYSYQLTLTDSTGKVILSASIPYSNQSGGNFASTTWYLYNQATSGVTPAGQNMQTEKSGVTGWQPVKTVNTTPGYWYSPALTGTYSAGTWSFTLWTNGPGSSSNITVELYKVNADGSSASLLGTQSKDVSTSGTGNHPTTYSYNLSSLALSNQKLMVKIVKASGADATMCYNTNDFPTRLVTP